MAAEKTECDAPDLLDEVRVLLLSSRFDVRHAAVLISKLRDCAERAEDDGDSQVAAAYRDAAAEIELRLRSP
jgi:hypothetical protein